MLKVVFFKKQMLVHACRHEWFACQHCQGLKIKLRCVGLGQTYAPGPHIFSINGG
jgi:hypothetical protein